MSLSGLFNRFSTNADIPLLPLHASRTPTPYQTAPASPDAQQPLQRPKMASPKQIPQSEPLLALSRQESHLQSHLQYLLDAQSDGLLAGLTGAPQGSNSSTGSRTPTTTTSNPRSRSYSRPREVIPVRQPSTRKPNLHSARKGITRTISSLSALKSNETDLLSSEITHRENILAHLTNLTQKTTGLQSQIDTIASSPTTSHLSNLKSESQTLATSIHSLETRLYEMRARHHLLLSQIQALENTTAAKLSSYTHALSLAEKEAKDFLSRPPIPTPTQLPSQRGARAEGIWALPAQRRTLELAREQYADEQNALSALADAVSDEKSALEEGQHVWEDVLAEVNAVETSLRTETRKLQQGHPALGDDAGTAAGMETVLHSLRAAEGRVEKALDVAEWRGWKLLVCCVGAELEALIQGRGVLEGVVQAARAGALAGEGGEGMEAVGVGDGVVGGGEVDGRGEREGEGGTEEGDILGLADATPGVGRAETEDEDEGPGPELLVSHEEG